MGQRLPENPLERIVPARYLPSRHTIAVIEGLFVAFLWSSSYVLIKIGLEDLPAITFAGLRYSLAAVFLAPVVVRRGHVRSFAALSRGDWLSLGLLGFVWYAVTPGTQYLGLEYLPAVTVSMLINFAPIVVALSGIVLLNEAPSRDQWFGIALYVTGVIVYFLPASLGGNRLIGLAVMGVCVLANAGSTVIGRYVNRDGEIHSVTVTFVSMAVGAAILMTGGAVSQGIPHLGPRGILLVGVLALVNTALAYTFWNHALQELTAVEASIILSTILVQVAVFGWFFLGETITMREGAGLALVGVGTLIVQFRQEGH